MNRQNIRIISLSLLIFIFLSFYVRAETSFVQSALEPFKYVNIEQAYDKYSGFVDFVVFLLVFMGMAKVTLGRKFEGRGGNLIVVGIGIAMAVSMAVTEHLYGFNLKSFGTIAGIIFTILVGLILFLALKSIGLKIAGATSFTLVIIYLLMRAANPVFFKWIESNIPFVHTIILFVFIVSLWEFAVLIWPKKLMSLENIKLPKLPSRDKTPLENVQAKQNLQKEATIIKKELEQIPLEDQGRGKNEYVNLTMILEKIRREDVSEEEKEKIKASLNKMRAEQTETHTRLEYLKEMNNRFENYDLSLYSDLHHRFQKLPHYAKKEVLKEIKEQGIKIKLEKEIETIANEHEEIKQHFRTAIDKAIECLETENKDEAITAIRTALVFEKKSRIIDGRIYRIEKRLYDITRSEIETYERAAS